MSIEDYKEHYLAMPDMIYFLLVSFGVVLVVHLFLFMGARIKASAQGEKKRSVLAAFFEEYSERYYELIFSSTSILLFIGIYFWIDFNYFDILTGNQELWNQYQDFLLLGFIIVSVLLNSIIDHLLVPMRRIDSDRRNTLRMMGMLYMMVIFLYIKFIYEDNNYDKILFYFLTLVIGRFVYFDASIHEFCASMKKLFLEIPILMLVLLSTALLAIYGFGTGYLLRSNGVVVSLFIAHFFVILEVFLLARTGILSRLMKAKKKK